MLNKYKNVMIELYSRKLHDKCKYTHYENWSQVPENLATKTQLQKKYKVPAKIITSLKSNIAIRAFHGTYNLYPIPVKYLPQSSQG